MAGSHMGPIALVGQERQSDSLVMLWPPRTRAALRGVFHAHALLSQPCVEWLLKRLDRQAECPPTWPMQKQSNHKLECDVLRTGRR
jgi:hypothetical protein